MIEAGQRFGRWVAVCAASYGGKGHRKWLCRCDCGVAREVSVPTLTSGASRSCGCLQRDVATRTSTVHGGAGTPEYRAWKHMRGRCVDPHDKRYANYGARGIVVCDRWHDFALFLADLGPRPTPSHSLERLKVDGNYEPGNVVWATIKEQSRNKTVTAFIEVDGRIGKVTDLAEEIGLPYWTLFKRAQRGSFGVRFVSRPN